MKTTALSLALASFVAVSLPLAAAEGDGDWLGAFRADFVSGAAEAFPSSRPSEALLGLASRIGEIEFASLDPAEAAALSLGLAASMEDGLRSGLALQEVGARSRQEARIIVKARASAGGSGGGSAALLRMRLRQAEESRRDRSGRLADPLGQRQGRHGAGGLRAR